MSRSPRSPIAVAFLVCLAMAFGPAASPAAATPSPSTRSDKVRAVIVRAASEAEARVRARIVALGGRVVRDLPIIDGFAARMPRRAVDTLAYDPDVLSVSGDRTMRPMAYQSSLGYDTADTGSLSSISGIVRAQDQWAKGYTGAGVGVALIDTGVTPVPGLATSGKVVHGPDLSFDSQSPALARLDSFGHGTHMAGIIAGRDSNATSSANGCTACLNSSGYSDQTKFVGIAPDAKIINVKVGATDGAADVSQVIAAIDWVVQHRKDAGLNIKVLNLSFGTNTAQPYEVDPLAHAAEVAWDNGIVVVAAAGNDGIDVPTLANPAYSPRLLAVGAADPMGTAHRLDDTVPSFATHGTELRGVDVIAPGTHVLSLRVPGSYVDTYHPGGVVGTRFQRASGTSQSTAVVSGLAALLMQQYPDATPDRIKSLLRLSAFRINANLFWSGMGIADVTAAAELQAAPEVYDPMVAFDASYTEAKLDGAVATPSSGTGSLEASRGDVHVTDGTVELRGEKDIFNKSFSAAAHAASAAKRTAWTGGTWNGSVWTGSKTTKSGWALATWSGTNWAGSPWSGSRWKDMAWDGSRWKGAGWAGSRWRSSAWTDAMWSGSRWR